MAGLGAGHLVLGLAFAGSSLPAAWIGLTIVGLSVSAVASYRHWRRLARFRFLLSQDGTLRVMPPGAPAFEARAGRGCRDLGWALWLAWRCAAEPGQEGSGQDGVLMLPRDALDPESWRTLRVWLRFCAGLDPSLEGRR
jgi:hypothetical protein